MKTLLHRLLAILPFLVSASLGNPLPSDPTTAWNIAQQHELVVVGTLEEQSILVVFADGKPVQQGGTKIVKSDDLPIDGAVLMSGRIEIEKVILGNRGALKDKKEIWVTWTESVYLREGYSGYSLCPHVSKDTKDGKRSLIFVNRGTGTYEVARDLDPKYLEWILEGRKAARLEDMKNSPFSEKSDPIEQQKTDKDNKPEMATPRKPSD